MLISQTVLLFSLITFTVVKTGKTTRKGARNSEKILTGLDVLMEKVLKRFTNCEVVFIQDRFSNLSVTFSTFSISISNLSLKNVNKDFAGVYQASIGSNITFPRHSDIHRFSKEHCSVGVMAFHEFNHAIETWLVGKTIPRYGPILRKDLDKFVFITPNEPVSNKVLSSSQFGSKIKYKLAIIIYQPIVLLKTMHLFKNGGLPNLTTLATFNTQTLKLKSGFESFFPDFTKTFYGKVFRFAIPKVAFRFEIEMRNDGKYHPKRGFYKWWLDEAMLKFNFTYHIFWASYGGGTGKRLTNGTWVGATGDIFYGKADCSFIVGEIYSRHKFLGWSSSISYEWVVFVTHLPRKSYSPKAIFKPFSVLMWALFLLSIVLVAFTLKVIAQFGIDPVRRKHNERKLDYFRIFEYILATFLEQDSREPYGSSSIRFLCAFWLVFGMVTATAYRGKLVSIIAFPVNEWVPTTFQELADSQFKVALNVVGKAGAAYVLIASSTSPIFQKITTRMELIPEAETCLERAMNEDLGCIIWKGIADYAAVKNLTDKNNHVPLQESTQIALFIGDGLVYEKRAIFGKHLDRSIQAVVQMGLTIKWFQLDQEFIKRERKIYEKSQNLTKPLYDYNDGGPKKLIVSQLVGVFVLLFSGFLISSGQFVAEHLWNRHKFKKHFIMAGSECKELLKSNYILYFVRFLTVYNKTVTGA